MATALRMPDIGTVEGEVTLVRWLKAEGDAVALGEPLFEVETDKGVSEVESAMAGVLVTRVLAEGAKAGTGEIIAYIRRPGEPEEEAHAGIAEKTAAVAAAMAGTPYGEPQKTFALAPAIAAVAGVPGGAARMPPAIRALADKWGVDLASVKGTGPGGMITRTDVLNARGGAQQGGSAAAGPAVQRSAAAATAPAVTESATAAGTAGATRTASAGRSLPRNQAIVARKVSQSHREKPVYRVSALVDMTKVIAFREQAKQGPEGKAPSFDAIFVKAAARGVAEFPAFRQYLRGEEVAEHGAVDVALAVGIGDELYAPAIRGADGKSVAEISRVVEELAKKAESRTLAPLDVEGSCFLVSNLGMFPIESFDAIIYPEHCAALAAGATAQTPVADGGSVRVAPAARLTLSVDHRLINGIAAARFLARVKQILETGEFA